MKRYLWILLLAACSAPTGEVTKTVKTSTETKSIQTKTMVTETPSPEVVDPEVVSPSPESTVTPTTVEQKTLSGTYFGIRKLNITEEINVGEDEEDIPNDRRLALTFKNGKVGFGDKDKEEEAKEASKTTNWNFTVDGDKVTVKNGNKVMLELVIRGNNNEFIYITQDNTDKIPQLKTSVKYEKTGLVLNGKEVPGGYGPGLENRVSPQIPPFSGK